ncbi:TrmB family transcriptional regulator [Pontibacter sp. JAM-7]|uniref:TrmB family transcriptional regulator n=1 Tax=Pontibacter sp. JAM-7 TaxID=3366581 RepID=UPI003AF46ED4
MTISNQDIYQLLNLSAREVEVYRALLQCGASSIRTIADKAGINRGTTYETLKALQSKGVVTYLPKGKRRFFAPREPDCLLHLAEERQANMERALEHLRQTFIPDLKHLQPAFSSANVQFFEGDEGIAQVLRDILTTVSSSAETGYSVFSSKPVRPLLYRPFPNFTSQRIQRGISVRVIAIGEGGEDAQLSERKWIKTDDRVNAAYIAIYPPKCAIISLAEKDYPTAVVIESVDVSAAQKIIFDTLWHLL